MELLEQLKSLQDKPELLQLAIIGYSRLNFDEEIATEVTVQNNQDITEAMTLLPLELQLPTLRNIMKQSLNKHLSIYNSALPVAYKQIFSRLSPGELIACIDQNYGENIAEALAVAARLCYDLENDMAENIIYQDESFVNRICQEYLRRDVPTELYDERVFSSKARLTWSDKTPEFTPERRIQYMQEQLGKLNEKAKDSPGVKLALEGFIRLGLNAGEIEEKLKYMALANKTFGTFILPYSEKNVENGLISYLFTPEQITLFIHESGIHHDDPRYQEYVSRMMELSNKKDFMFNNETSQQFAKQTADYLEEYRAEEEEIERVVAGIENNQSSGRSR